MDFQLQAELFTYQH